MPQSKRKSGTSGQRKNTVNNPPALPPKLLIRAFRIVAGQSQEISFLDGSGNADIEVRAVDAGGTAIPSPLDADGKWKRFDRLVVASGNATPLVLDVIPDNNAEIELTINQRRTKSTLKVDCRVRCVIADDDHIKFELTIDKERKKLTYSRVDFQGPFAITPIVSRLNLYPSPQPGVNPIPNIVQRTESNPHRVPLETNGFGSRMAEELGVEFRSPGSAENFMELFFQQVCVEENSCVFGVAFRASRPDDSNNTVRFIPLFGQDPNDRIGFRVPTALLTNGWRITQLPSRSLNAKSKGGEPARFHVILGGIPSRSPYDLWNSHVDDYWHALNTVRGGNPVSLLPRLVARPNDRPWEIFYLISDPTAVVEPEYVFGITQANRVSIFGSTVEPVTPYAAEFSLGQLMTQNNTALVLNGVISKTPLASDTLPPSGLTIIVNGPLRGVDAGNPDSRTVRLGALDITIGLQPPDGSAGSSRYELRFENTLTVDLATSVFIQRITPGGQDDLPGEEFVAQGEGLVTLPDERIDPCVPAPEPGSTNFHACVESGFRRKRPIVIGLPESIAISSNRLFWEGDETAKGGSSQTVNLRLLDQTPASSPLPDAQSKVIVLDSNPFLVAEVQYTAFSQAGAQETEIANWTNAGVEGAGWQLRQSSEGPAALVLPSQGIGEEMERGYPDNLQPGAVGPGRTITEGSLVDFRLSPPARLNINVGEREQRFIEAPWNLRRILGFPGQRTPGARVRQLQFELLYGLSCDVETPFLRLAEITALLGTIPGRLRMEPRWMPMTVENVRLRGRLYQQTRFDWSRLYRRYLSRLAILEPWDSHVKDSLILSENVQCRIRSVAEERDRVLIPKAELANPIDPSQTEGLRGGATWGFESKNIYNAVMRPEGQNPLSTSASVSDLYFSSLGGYGRLVAGFDKDRSKIYDDVSLGRTYSYKLERIGRIGCWWNRAKHVIVYERTVLPSRQFNAKQPRHAGRPIVRKVREYIKILDEKRTYPDGIDELSEEERKTLEMRRGFVAACSFPPGAEIPVDGSWGTDVLDIGWKIPLWNPAADPQIYPKPVMSAHFFSDVGGVSQPVPCVIKDPQNVFFYTDTRVDTSGDPNEWPPIKGVDYVDCPLPRPQTDFQNGNPKQTTPADTIVPAGFGPCTFQLEPPALPADLVAARAGKPLSAALESITITRATLKEAGTPTTPSTAATNIRDKFFYAQALGSNLKNPLGDLLRRIPSDGNIGAQSLAQVERDIGQSFGAGGAFQGFFAEVDRRCNDITTEINNIGALVRRREGELFTALEKQLVEVLSKRREAFINEIAEVIANTENIADLQQRLEQRRRQLLEVIDENIAALQNALLLLRLSPGLLQKSVARAAGDAARLLLESEAAVNRVLDRIAQYSVTLTAQQLSELKALTQELIRRVDSLFAILDSAVSQSLEAWLPDPSVFIVNRFLIDNTARPLRELIAEWKTSLNNTILQAQQLTQEAARQALAVETSWIEVVRANVTLLSTEAKNHVDMWRDSLVGELPPPPPPPPPPAPPQLHIERQLEALRAYVLSVTQADLRFLLLPDLVLNMLDREIPGPNITTQNILGTLQPLRVELNRQIENLLQFTTGAANLLCSQVGSQQARDALRDRLLAAIRSNPNVRLIEQAVQGVVDRFHSDVNQFSDAAMALFQRNREWPQIEDVYAAGNTALGIVRAFGRPPVVPNMSFERPALAYFYKELNDRVDLTPVLSTVAKASAVADALKPLGISFPTEGLIEKLVPPDLKNFDLSKIFPDFAGLNLKHLFPNLKLPSVANDNVKVSHGADPQSRRAWIDVDINFLMDRPATLFSIGPVTIRIVNARFEAMARVEASLGNEPPRRTVRGAIIGDWELTIGGQTLVIFRRTELRFDESGKLRFSLDPRNLEMPGILSFLQDFMKRFNDPSSGLTIGFAPGGVQAVLNLPIPDVQVGAFGLSNLRLGALLRVTVVGDDGFAITVGFNVGRKLAPFALTIFILGGGGYLEVEAKYVPAKKQITCSVELGIVACASLAISLGPIKGGVYVYFGITAQFRSGQGGGLTIGVMFLIRGEVSILGIVEACVSLLLEAKYSEGRLIGHGNLSIKIKICWCFTLEISEDVTYTIAGGGGSGRLEHPELEGLLAFNNPPAMLSNGDAISDTAVGFSQPQGVPQHYVDHAAKYIDLLT